MITTYNYYYFTGTHLGLSGAGGVLVTTINPILTTLFVFVISKNPLSQREGFGLLAGLLGGLILLEIWNQQVEQMVNGATGMFLICALTWSCITIVSPRALVSMHIFVYSFWIFLLASMFSLPIAWPIGINLVFIPIPIFWINMIIVSLGSLSFATSLYFIATKRLGPDKAASFVFVVPVSAMGFSMVIFSEPLQWHTLIGGSIAILAVYLINSGKSHKVLTNVPATQ
jgi:drug/metabolite transporter (DMT)-like permease